MFVRFESKGLSNDECCKVISSSSKLTCTVFKLCPRAVQSSFGLLDAVAFHRRDSTRVPHAAKNKSRAKEKRGNNY